MFDLVALLRRQMPCQVSLAKKIEISTLFLMLGAGFDGLLGANVTN